MPIALPHLPVDQPEWDGAPLPRCPRCDYVLANIPEDRCPECGFGYSLTAVERVEQFIGVQAVRDYRTAMQWSLAGLLLAGLPLVLPRAGAPPFIWIALVALFAPTLVGLVQALRAFSRDWAIPRWVWFSPLLGVLLVAATIFPGALVLLGAGASGMGAVSLFRTADIPDVLSPLDSHAGRRLRRWRTAAWTLLGLGLLLQLSLIARFR